MPEFLRGNLALFALRSLFAIRERRRGSNGCSIPDSRVRAPAVSANHQTFADVIDARKFSCPLIGVEVYPGLCKYAAHNFTACGIKFDFLPGRKRNDVMRARATNSWEIVAGKKNHDAIHDLA
jgi:hypothetical protein